MYQELLKKLGFDDKEIAVFIAVLERGKVTPATVATITGINRSTVYSIAKVLADKGILRIDTTSEPSYLIIESADVLENIVKREERQLLEKKKVVFETMKILENIPRSKNYSVPKVKFYNEKEMKNALYDRLPFWIESGLNIGESLWWGTEDGTWTQIFPEWIDHHWKTVPEKIGARFITNKKLDKDQKIDSRRQSKYIDSTQHDFTANQVVIGDYVIYIMTSEKPYYMIEIHDRVMAHNFRQVFKLMWEKF